MFVHWVSMILQCKNHSFPIGFDRSSWGCQKGYFSNLSTFHSFTFSDSWENIPDSRKSIKMNRGFAILSYLILQSECQKRTSNNSRFQKSMFEETMTCPLYVLCYPYQYSICCLGFMPYAPHSGAFPTRNVGTVPCHALVPAWRYPLCIVRLRSTSW